MCFPSPADSHHYYGGKGTYGTLKRFCYQFEKPNRKLYRKKLKQLEENFQDYLSGFACLPIPINRYQCKRNDHHLKK
jgi:hypothetical protein